MSNITTSDRRISVRLLRAIALLVGWSLAAGSASAQFTNWTNPTLGNWFVGSNWSNGVPSSNSGSTTATISNGGTALIDFPSGFAYVDGLSVGGTFGTGSLLILHGELNQSTSFLFGGGATVTGSATVTGAGSRWNADNSLSLAGNGTLKIESGADVVNAVGRVEGNGVATVTGAGSTWTNFLELYVGGTSGASALRITSQGFVQADSLRISSAGSVEVNNGSSTTAGLSIIGGAIPSAGSAFGGLTVGNTSNGRMVVLGGGVVFNSFGTIGAVGSSSGSVLVQGAGSTWTNTDQVVAGLSGFGTLEVLGGGTLNSVRGFAGANVNSSGTITVSDPGSTWNASGSFFIGNSGSGLLQVLNGGVASTAGNSHLGFTAGATGDVVVSGAGSTFNVGVLLNIGGDSAVARGVGSVGIADGGTVNVGSATNLYSTGRLNLLNEATLTGEINSFGGLISTRGATTLTNAIHLHAGGVSVEPNLADGVATLSGVIDGAGGLTKSTLIGITGNGTLVLTAANTYTGPTTVNRGTLLIDGSITSPTTVNSGAALGGSGTIAADVINNGIVAPGNSPGTLSIAGNYTQNAGGKLTIEIESPDDFDRLAVTGAMALGGTLEISLINGFTPSADQAFDILSWGSLTGAFQSVILPTQEGLTWDTSQLSTGVISVAVVAPPLEADFDEDTDVDDDDFTLWSTGFGTLDTATHLEGDADGDLDVDGGDFLVWQRQTGSGTLAAVAATSAPEPAGFKLLAIGFTVFGAKSLHRARRGFLA